MRPRAVALISALAVGLAASVGAQTSDPTDPAPMRIGPVLLTGYIQFDFLTALAVDGDTLDNTFRFRRVRFQLAGPVTDDISWAVSAETTTSPVLRDAYVVLKYLPQATVRVGQLVMPYGYERYVTSSNRIEFTERWLNELAPGRDAGVMVSNEVPFRGWLSYGAALVNGTGQNVPDDNGAKDLLGRFAVLPPRLPGLETGINAARGTQPDGVRTRTGVDVSYERRNYHLVAEYSRETVDGVVPRTRDGYYVVGSWKIHPTTPRPALHHIELAARVGRRTRGTGTARQIDVTANYYVRRNFRLMFNLIVRPDHAPDDPRAVLHARTNILF